MRRALRLPASAGRARRGARRLHGLGGGASFSRGGPAADLTGCPAPVRGGHGRAVPGRGRASTCTTSRRATSANWSSIRRRSRPGPLWSIPTIASSTSSWRAARRCATGWASAKRPSSSPALQRWPARPPGRDGHRRPTCSDVLQNATRVGLGGMPGGERNPLGARALYLFKDGKDTLYRIHGTTEPSSIGKAVSSGCIRMLNQDVIDLHRRVPTGTRVVVLGVTRDREDHTPGHTPGCSRGDG